VIEPQLAYLGSGRYVGIGDQKDDIIDRLDCSPNQNLGVTPCDPAGWEVNHCDHLMV